MRRVPLVRDVHATTRKGRVKRALRLDPLEIPSYVKGFQTNAHRTIRNRDSVAMMRLRRDARWVLTAKGRMA